MAPRDGRPRPEVSRVSGLTSWRQYRREGGDEKTSKLFMQQIVRVLSKMELALRGKFDMARADAAETQRVMHPSVKYLEVAQLSFIFCVHLTKPTF